MTHNLAVGTVVAGHMTVNGVTGVTVGGVIVANDTASEAYFVAVRFKQLSHDTLRAAAIVSMATPVVVTTL